MTAARRTGDNGHSHSAAAPATHPHAEPQDAPKTNIDSSESKAYHVSHGAHGNSDAPALHDKHAGHSVEMFRRKFWGTVLLSVPTLVWAPMIQQWLGYEAWGGSRRITVDLRILWDAGLPLRWLRFHQRSHRRVMRSLAEEPFLSEISEAVEAMCHGPGNRTRVIPSDKGWHGPKGRLIAPRTPQPTVGAGGQ